MHIGKASAFAGGGVPISAQVLERTTVSDLARLSAMITATAAEKLVVLGDLLHATAGRDPRTLSLLASWRREHTGVDFLLVRGNHDIAAGDPPDEVGIRCVDEPFDGDGLVLVHHPRGAPTETPTLAGHLHPGIKLQTAGDALRAPCYWLSGGQLVLPAFGGFTGKASIAPGPGDRVFALGDETVVEVPVVVSARGWGTSVAR